MQATPSLQYQKAMKMTELPQAPEAASWLVAFFWKFMPAPLGAVVMVVFDMPKTRGELFVRLTVAYLASIMLGEVVFDFLDSIPWFSFLDIHNRKHFAAVEFLTAGAGWSLLAGFATVQRKFRDDPGATIKEAKEVLRP